jgi:hypothetical protein
MSLRKLSSQKDNQTQNASYINLSSPITPFVLWSLSSQHPSAGTFFGDFGPQSASLECAAGLIAALAWTGHETTHCVVLTGRDDNTILCIPGRNIGDVLTIW